jgi:hypothetical protein
MRKLLDVLALDREDVLFVGDRLDEAGNDYPVLAMGVPCLAVSNWQETADFLDRLLDEPPGRSARQLAGAGSV